MTNTPHLALGQPQTLKEHLSEATIPYLINCLSVISWELETAIPPLGAVAFCRGRVAGRLGRGYTYSLIRRNCLSKQNVLMTV